MPLLLNPRSDASQTGNADAVGGGTGPLPDYGSNNLPPDVYTDTVNGAPYVPPVAKALPAITGLEVGAIAGMIVIVGVVLWLLLKR